MGAVKYWNTGSVVFSEVHESSGTYQRSAAPLYLFATLLISPFFSIQSSFFVDKGYLVLLKPQSNWLSEM